MDGSPYINHFLSADTIVPGMGNPQALNRYSYTLGNPLKYTDPSGHSVCGLSGSGVCDKDEELLAFADKTVIDYGEKNDLEAVVRIVDKAAKLYHKYDEMIPALSTIFLGTGESNSLTIWHAATGTNRCAAVGRSVEDCRANGELGSFGDTGFHRDFRDGFSQPFHFWAYLATAANTEGIGPASYVPGRLVDSVANAYHEAWFPDGPGATWQDVALAQAGADIGMLVNLGVVPPDQLGSTIRDYVGIGGPGAFYVNPLKSILPLVGNR